MVDVHIPDNFVGNFLKIGILVVMVIMLANFLKPSLTGNLVQDIENLNSTVTSCREVVESQRDRINRLNDTLNIAVGDVENLSDELGSCLKLKKVTSDELASLRKENNETVQELNSIEVDYKDYKRKLNESNMAYLELAESTANTICCMKRVENPAINYYVVRDDKIKCLEDGDLELDCP